MTSDPQNDPRRRMREILSSGAGEETRPMAAQDASPLARLPRARSVPPASSTPPPVAASVPPAAPAQRRSWSRFGPAFWTVTGLMSLVVNGILIAVLLYLASSVAALQLTASDTGATVLSGFYTNFEKMDRASITSTIPVDAQIPLSINVPIQKTTTITLASDATIPNARVRINSATLNIDAPAQVVLPAGTTLDVALAFDIQVQDSIPIHLDVPVNIPLSQTQLHEPFTGLQNVIKPFYCLIEPNALNLDGLPVCLR